VCIPRTSLPQINIIAIQDNDREFIILEMYVGERKEKIKKMFKEVDCQRLNIFPSLLLEEEFLEI
jgi:hypothetical protein